MLFHVKCTNVKVICIRCLQLIDIKQYLRNKIMCYFLSLTHFDKHMLTCPQWYRHVVNCKLIYVTKKCDISYRKLTLTNIREHVYCDLDTLSIASNISVAGGDFKVLQYIFWDCAPISWTMIFTFCICPFCWGTTYFDKLK